MFRRTAPAVLTTIVCAVGLFAASAAPWIHASVSTTLEPVTVDVAGSDAAPAVTALGLVAAAAAVASTLSGRWLRVIVGVVVALAGVGAIAATLAVTADPAPAARSSVGASTGVVGTGGQFTLTAFPWCAVVAAALLVLCGVWLILVARNAARRTGHRFERDTRAAPRTGTSTHGDSATTSAIEPSADNPSADDAAGTGPSAASADPSARAAQRHADEIDAWDALTRGEDPTQR